MSEIVASSLLASATAQLGQLALAAVVVAALVGLLAGVQRWRGSKAPTGAVAADRAAPTRSPLLVGVLLLSLLILILAAGLRQIWGHPVLQPRVLISLTALMLLAILVWWRAGVGDER